jgi:transmembrane sensor
MSDLPIPPTPAEAVLVKYFQGTASQEERDRVETWAAADPRHREALRLLRAGWDASAGLPTDATHRMSRNRVLARIEAGDSSSLKQGPATTRESRWITRLVPNRLTVRDLIAVAAGVVVAVIGVRVVSSRAKPLRGPGVAEYATAVAERATVTLTDGTRVVLGPASHLQVSIRPDGGARDVYLAGEAMFSVHHDAARLFTVHTRSAETRDVGTTFGVRAYDGEPGTRVVVSEGEVAVRRRGMDGAAARADSVLLSAGELGGVDANGDLQSAERVTVQHYLGWTNGELVFDYTPLGEALPELGRWYGLDVRLADSSLASRRISATFTTESPTEVLTLLGKILGLAFERRGQVVVVRRP